MSRFGFYQEPQIAHSKPEIFKWRGCLVLPMNTDEVIPREDPYVRPNLSDWVKGMRCFREHTWAQVHGDHWNVVIVQLLVEGWGVAELPNDL